MAKKRARVKEAPAVTEDVVEIVPHSIRPVDLRTVAAAAPLMQSYKVDTKKPKNKEAKKKADLWVGSQRNSTRDSYFKGLSQVARAKFGSDDVFFGAEAGQLAIGLPLPSISLEFLFGMSSLPINIFMLITGDTDSRKSTLLYEMFRWFDQLGGGTFLAECESKYNEQWVRAVANFDDDNYPLVTMFCDTQADQQNFITGMIKEHQVKLVGTQDNPGPGRTVPTLFAIDSLTGKFSEERVNKIMEKGHAERDFSTEALHMGPFISTVITMAKNWPFMVAAVSHVSRSKEPGSFTETRSKRGGVFKDYQQGVEIELSHARHIDEANFEGYEMQIQTYKNSYAPKNRRIRSRILWWYEETGQDDFGRPKLTQRAAWDWDWSAGRLMVDLHPKRKRILKEKYGVSFQWDKETNHVTPLIKCSGYNLCGGEYVHFREMGAAIRQDPEMQSILRNALNIRDVPVMRGDYLDQLNEQRDSVA